MKVVACYKIVPNMDNVPVNPDRTLNLKSADWEIGQYDLRAIEEAAKLAAATGGKAVALSAGGDILSNSKMKKGTLSRGPAEMLAIQDESLTEADSYVTATALKAGVEKIGDVDVIICGEGSSDQYNQQVGNILGGLLGWSTLNGISKVEADGSLLKLERTVEDGVEILEVETPAVISVTSDINMPRIPSMKDILGAGKKPSTIVPAADVAVAAGVTAVASVLAPQQKARGCEVVDKVDDDAIAAFAEKLLKAL